MKEKSLEEGIRYLSSMNFIDYDKQAILLRWVHYKSYSETLRCLFADRKRYSNEEWTDLCNFFSAKKQMAFRTIVTTIRDRYYNEESPKQKLIKLFGENVLED